MPTKGSYTAMNFHLSLMNMTPLGRTQSIGVAYRYVAERLARHACRPVTDAHLAWMSAYDLIEVVVPDSALRPVYVKLAAGCETWEQAWDAFVVLHALNGGVV